MTQSTSKTFEPVIGLEVHVQLNTQTKIFCACRNLFGGEPNSRVCPVCLGYPGSLPVLNRAALDSAIKIGLALNCEINPFVKFDRKNYFYPDCPKAYQISQYDFPICKNGHVMIPLEDGSEKIIRVHRAHLEEDAGKLIHEAEGSLVDYNRTGTPLLEIVSEADLRSPQEAYDYLQNLKWIISYLNVSDCDMEKGSLRCDANVSIRPSGQETFGTKAEIKNMNSFRAVREGISYEIQRQTQVLLAGETVVQETRLWDENRQLTLSMRSKEEAHDYRYFPEPDLVPFTISEEDIDRIRQSLPELPQVKRSRFVETFHLSEYDATILVQTPETAAFFESAAALSKETKKICNWMNGPVLQETNSRNLNISELPLSPEHLVTIIQKMDDGTISNLAAKETLKKVLDTGKSPETIIEEEGLAQVSDDSALESILDDLILEHPDIADQIRGGKEKAVGFLVGQAMKKTQGKANPKKIGELVKRRLLNG